MASRGQLESMDPSTVPSTSHRTSRTTIARTTRTLERRRRSSAPDASRQDRGRKMSQDKQAESRAGHALDALNFFLADVRDGLGPYLAIYLLTEQKWDQASIGAVMSIAAIAGIAAQTPAGALIDRSPAKRALIIAAAIVVTIACVALPLLPRFELVAATQAVASAAGAIFAPGIAAVTLGIVGPNSFAKRTGRNEAFNHAGNAAAA